ncbi:hypothetical protein A6770_35015 [Nostoc minutum NIES-26]|uniref:Uncharacterized protein n=1 Tax=Nostoc minutum NIES-26 TaxID=1844469 RepID=A0A367S2A9_9NOSO|nr:hypothetical protein A6770_35015 [Nostoc minutum NIES-26]
MSIFPASTSVHTQPLLLIFNPFLLTSASEIATPFIAIYDAAPALMQLHGAIVQLERPSGFNGLKNALVNDLSDYIPIPRQK